jgi:putative heme-binding domain-containing protein
MELFGRAVEDSHAQVRLEAVCALRTVGTREAVEVGLRATSQPVDKWLDFALFRLAHEFRDQWLPDLQAGEPMFDGDPDRVAFAVSAAGDAASLAPLAELVLSNRIIGQQLVDTVAVLAALGDAKERQLVLDRIEDFDVTARNRVLTALLQANRGSPPSNSDRLLELLSDSDATTRVLATKLAGRWQLVAAKSALRHRAASAGVADNERLAAAEALVAIDTSEAVVATLREIYESSGEYRVRATAVAAWARASAESAAPQAAKQLSAAKDTEQAAIIVEAFLSQRDGPQELAKAIEQIHLSNDVAQLVIDRVRVSGKEMPELMSAVRTAAGISQLAKDLTSEDIASILRDLSTKGSVQRGQQLFQRERLQCVTCHAVGGKGGAVGPDLTSLGGSARVVDILQSMLEPSASIKEGFQTSHVITTDGRIITGILQQQTATQIRIRDAQNNLLAISTDDIEEIEPSKLSVMPSGLTEILTRDELVDLVRYLSTLGVR